VMRAFILHCHLPRSWSTSRRRWTWRSESLTPASCSSSWPWF
jgi:hypothetical protein